MRKYYLNCAEQALPVTTCPPLSVPWGVDWWAQVDGSWRRLRDRHSGEVWTKDLAQELCTIV